MVNGMVRRNTQPINYAARSKLENERQSIEASELRNNGITILAID